uniref:ATP-dependent DNA helicase Q4 isoform X1 n=1 Tax=Osmia lignaria TaxID=473952 RepID=UPI0014782843|nr:ATP-dependent DNA helicase Q4 isoform X1 [Osmia lignaria]
MEILEDPTFKTQYQKYKNRVKLWESRFTEKHGRKPNKNDIKEADIKIKESYKMYWKLKTRALEETLIDITFSEEVQDNVLDKTLTQTSVEETKEDNKPLSDDNKQNLENVSQKVTENTDINIILSTDNKDIENVDPHCQNQDAATTTSLVVKNECTNMKGVWGDHLSKSNEIYKKKETLLVGRSSSFQLSQNKFTSSMFVKRNPRKSLSASKIKSKSEKSMNIQTNVSEESTNTETHNEDGIDVNKKSTSVFNNPVKVTYTESTSGSQSINTIQQVIAGHTVSRNLNPAWLDRCAKQNNVEYSAFDSQRLSGTSDSGIESMESSIYSPKENTQMSETSKHPLISDEEDFVCNSDSEETWRNKRIRNFKKNFSDQEIHCPKRPCLDNNINVPTMQQLPTNMNVHGVHSLKVSNEVKYKDFSTTNVIADKDNDRSDNTTIVTNVANDNDKCIDENSDTETTNKNSTNRRKVRRRIKHISSDDSDPDFNENNKVEGKKKEKSSKTKRKSSTRKNKSTKEPTSKQEKNSTFKTKRTSRKKKYVQSDDDNFLENGTTDLETTDKGSEIYGVETLQAVPRFSINMSNQGDLIEQCTKSVSSTATNSTKSVALPKSKGKLTDKEKLEKKIADGNVNENFVRINLKKKIFVRGKKHFNFSKYKKNQWKQRKKDLQSSENSLVVADYLEKKGVSNCFKCGEVGHFSRNCPNSNTDDLIPLGEIDDGSEFLTLEEAQEMASQNALIAHANRIDRLPEKPSYSSKAEAEHEGKEIEKSDNDDLWEPIENEELLCGHKIPDELVTKLLPPIIDTVQPLYKLKEDQSCIETPAEVFETLEKFGHKSFKPGQEKAIMRILSGQSTLVTLSTGSGKSLCYQLPAYLYSKYSNCITLVISPLVSLMDDQVTGVPFFLSAACLHTNQTEKVRNNVMQMVKQGKLNILLISPEAVVAGEKSTGFGALLRQLPPIAFACIDEAHCISQWSHNFRPSYLMVCRVLKEKMGVKTVLALTATATKTTTESIVNHLGLHDGMAGVISDIPMPRNLMLTVSRDEHRDRALIELLQSERFKQCNSIIVYCTRREECVRIAGLLRVSLQDTNNFTKPNSKLSPIAEAYHAGLPASRRKTVQKAFMNGQIRIVVATVAFGMGINKSDIRAIIHYNMPGTFENYVQEVGRAGRDGQIAHCHMFLHPKEDGDKWELRRHIYANGVDRHSIRRLLQKVFVPCSCAKIQAKDRNYRCPGHEVAIPVDETVIALDISAEIISTLLCYLELHPKRFITVLSSVYVRARVSSYGGPQALKQAAQSSPPLAMAIALDLQKGVSHDNSSVIEFPVVDVASAIGWDSGVVKSHLKNLEWKTGLFEEIRFVKIPFVILKYLAFVSVNGTSKRSNISVRYDTLGLRVKAPGDLTDEELDEALETLVDRARFQETAALQQLETISATLHKLSMPSVKMCLELNDEVTNKSNELKDIIRNYFEGKILVDIDSVQQTKVENDAQIVSDVRNLIVSYRDNNFTGRAIARIFHGIQSPNYPAYAWNKCRFWRAHLSCNFNALCQIATKEILALR